MAVSRYPWNDWFDKGTFKLRHGVDYHVDWKMMAQQIRNAASARGLKVSVNKIPSGLKVTVRERSAKK